jgi:hypothetical protein
VGRVNRDPYLVVRFNPPVENASAREDEGMRAVVVDDGQFQITVEGRGHDGLPHRPSFYPMARASP